MSNVSQYISESQLEALEAQDAIHLAMWWCVLNSWEWPEDLPDPQPRPRRFDDDHPSRSAIMHWIDNKIGHRAVLRFHNKDMSDEVFDSFMRGERERGTPYGDYSKKRVDEIMARIQQRDDDVIASEFILDSPLDAEFIE